MTGLAFKISEKRMAFPLGYSGPSVSSCGKKNPSTLKILM